MLRASVVSEIYHRCRTVPSPRPRFWFDLVVIPIVEIRPSAHILDCLPLWLAYFHHSVVCNSAVCGAVSSERCTVRAHSPHSGYSRARPLPGSHHGGTEPPDCWPGYQMGQKATIVPKPRHEAAALQAMFHDMFAYQSGLSIHPWNYVSLLFLGRWPLDHARIRGSVCSSRYVYVCLFVCSFDKKKIIRSYNTAGPSKHKNVLAVVSKVSNVRNAYPSRKHLRAQRVRRPRT
jgi:hypothetical protein